MFDPARIPVPLHIEIGRTVLTVSELRRLQPFDVVLLDYTEYPDQDRVFVRCGSSLAFYGTVAQSQVILEGPVMPEAQDESVPVSHNVSDLPCELRFELARIALPLGLYPSLQPGFALNLPHPTYRRVSVVAGDVTLASGEMVPVGSHLGVRLDRLEPSLPAYDPAAAAETG